MGVRHLVQVHLALVAAVGTAWLMLGDDSGWFWIITATAILLELFFSRQLVREWGHEASFRWWWAR